MNKKNKTSTTSFDDFVNEKLQNDPELADKLLETALEEYKESGHERSFLVALDQVDRASRSKKVSKVITDNIEDFAIKMGAWGYAVEVVGEEEGYYLCSITSLP